MTGLLKRAETLIDALNFDECVELYEKVEAGNPMIDLIFDRMETLDVERFENWV